MSTVTEMPLSEMVPGGLWQSGCPVRLEKVHAARINAIVNVGHEQQQWLKQWAREVDGRFHGPVQPRHHVYARIPLYDAPGCIDVPATDAAIGLVLALLRDRARRVLVHCEAGVYRSVHVTAGVLARLEGLDYAAAFREADRRAGVEPHRDCLGLDGWDRHARTFGNRRATHDGAPQVARDPHTPKDASDETL